MAETNPINLMGLTVSGDFGAYTIYTDRFGKKVFYPKAPPDKPPSVLQQRVRDAFKDAQAQYRLLTPAAKIAWEELVGKANLCMTGQNLLIHTAMIHDYDVLDTLMHQTGVTVTPPTPV